MHIEAQAPNSFDFGNYDRWSTWRRSFERYRIRSLLDLEPEVNQINTLLDLMGEESNEILDSFNLSDYERNKYEIVMENFERYFDNENDYIVNRQQFFSRSQQPFETIMDFLLSLYEISSRCAFSNRQQYIKSRLVAGLLDKNLKVYLQGKGSFSLSEIIDSIKFFQMIQSGKKRFSRSAYVYSKEETRLSPTKNCIRCNRRHYTNLCPPIIPQCEICNSKEHLSANCSKVKLYEEMIRLESKSED